MSSYERTLAWILCFVVSSPEGGHGSKRQCVDESFLGSRTAGAIIGAGATLRLGNPFFSRPAPPILYRKEAAFSRVLFGPPGTTSDFRYVYA